MVRLFLLAFAAVCLTAQAAMETTGPEVSFSTPSKVGAVTLPPGLYRLKVQGSVMFLTDPNTKKSFTVLVRTEKVAKKSSFTAAMGRVVDGTQQVECIVLEGADYKLVF